MVTASPKEIDFRRVLDAFSDAVVAADGSERIVYANAAAHALLGYEGGGLLGEPLTALMPERMRSQHEAGFRRFRDTHVPRLIGRAVRVPALRKDGSEIDVELTLAAFPMGQGDDLFIGSLRDLSDRVELERQLTVTRYMRAATRTAARLGGRLDLDHVLATVVDSLVADFDAALARVWLYEPIDHSLRLSASAGLSHETARSSRASIDVDTSPYKVGVVARTRVPFVKNGLLGDADFDQAFVAREKIASVAVHPILLGDELRGVMACFFRTKVEDEVSEVLATFSTIVASALHDVSLFARAEVARRVAVVAERSQRLLADAGSALAASLDYEATLQAVARIAVPQLADGCVVDLVDEDGTLRRIAAVHADPVKAAWAEKLLRLGAPAADAPVHAVIRRAEAVILELDDAAIGRVARDPEHLEILRALAPRSGMIVPMIVRGRVIGTLWLFASTAGRYGADDLTLAKDIAARAALAVENARLFHEAKEAIDLRDDFLSIASHELRTPLTSLTLQIETLLRGTLDPDKRAARLEQADRQVHRLTNLVEQLLDVSRITTGRLRLEPEPFDLAPLVDEIVHRFDEELRRSGSELTLRIQPAQGVWDRIRIEQVVTNLVANAVKYGEGKPIEVALSSDGSTARFIVKDHGIGVAAEQQARIFERFERAVSSRSYGGFGLGLWIARQIVKTAGGTIQLESATNEGSTFTVELPTAGPPDSDGASAPAPSSR